MFKRGSKNNALDKTKCDIVCFKVDNLITQYNKKGKPVAALIVEPIQAEGGDHHASVDFFHKLQRLTKKVNGFDICISFLVTGYWTV